MWGDKWSNKNTCSLQEGVCVCVCMCARPCVMCIHFDKHVELAEQDISPRYGDRLLCRGYTDGFGPSVVTTMFMQTSQRAAMDGCYTSYQNSSMQKCMSSNYSPSK